MKNSAINVIASKRAAQEKGIKSDNTSIKKNDMSKTVKEYVKREAFKPDYRYVDTYLGAGNATKKDSLDYKDGFYEQKSNSSRGKGDRMIGIFNSSEGNGSQEYNNRTYKK